MHRVVFRLLAAHVALAGLLLWAYPAPAQQTLRIAAIVNDEVISVFDVTERIKIVLLSSGLPDTPEQRERLAPRVLQALVDETLQVQAADSSNISVSDADIQSAFRELEDRNGIPDGQLPDFLLQNQIHPGAMEKQLRAMIAWRKLITRQIVPTIAIGQEEIDVVAERIAAIEGQTQYRVSEIVLALEQVRDEPQTLELANRLVEQIRAGASFGGVAQQFSQSASAAVGGDLGWVRPGQFGAEVDIALAKSQPGDVIGPVRLPDRIQIYQLIDRRTVTATGGGDLEVSLRQLLLPVAEDAPEETVERAVARAREAAANASSCGQFAIEAERLGTPQPDQPSRIRLGDLSPQLQQTVGTLAANQVSEPLTTPYGVQLIMVCERHNNAGGPDRDGIAEQLARERIDMLARRMIRDLRRAAFIDVRI